MGSAAEERIKYLLPLSAVNAIIKDERCGLGPVRINFNLPAKKNVKAGIGSTDIFLRGCQKYGVLGIGTSLVRRDGRGNDGFASGSFKYPSRRTVVVQSEGRNLSTWPGRCSYELSRNKY